MDPSLLGAYSRDGIVLIRNAIDRKWVEHLLRGVRRIHDMPDNEISILPEAFLERDPKLRNEISAIRSTSAEERRLYTEQSEGFIRYKYMYWWMPEFREFILHSPAGQVVGETIGAESLRFFIDAIFLKQAACDTKTYWHADEPAWPVSGEHVPTMWMPLLPVSAKQSSLEYIVGSHLHRPIPAPWPNTYNARIMGRPSDRPQFHDWEENRGDPDVFFIAFDMEPGDVVIMHPNLQHGGGANLHPTQPRIAYSTRWFGNDVRWDPRPECVNIPGMPMNEMERGTVVDRDEVFPLVYERGSASVVS